MNFHTFVLIIFTFIMSSNSKAKSIEIGDKIPSFELKDQNGKLFRIDSVVGEKNLVIYFYPKDDSPGCTKQACSFRDQYEDFMEADAMVIGISGQSVESHKKFAEKHNLPFTLLSDEGNNVRKMFGVPSNMFGAIPGRVTYVVNMDGIVILTFNSQTNVTRHVEEALDVLKD
jgi:peroxiredoxin Q/BCP